MASPNLILPLVLIAGVAVIALAILFSLPQRRALRNRTQPRAAANVTSSTGSESLVFSDGGAGADCASDGGGGGGGCD